MWAEIIFEIIIITGGEAKKIVTKNLGNGQKDITRFVYNEY